MDERMLTLQETAEELRLPYEVVRDNVYSGRWPHKKFGERTRRVSEDDLARIKALVHHEPVAETRSDAHSRRKRVSQLLRAI